MEGWVYVITNKAMPGLVKVGYTKKDPDLRAAELSHTGSPHPYLVEYGMQIEDPYLVEQKTHKLLSPKREAKEWFRCGPEEAVVAIREVGGNRKLNESYKRVERHKADALYQRKKRDREIKIQKREAEKQIENRLAEEESTIRQKYNLRINAKFPPRPFWLFWLGNSILVYIGIFLMMPDASAAGLLMFAVIGGSILGIVFKNHLENINKESTEYLALQKQRTAELESVRSIVTPCPTCSKKLRFNRAKLHLNSSRLVWRCPSCKTAISPPRT